MKIYSFCKALREARNAKSLPLRKVAAFLDIDQSTLSKIERGERVAPRDIIKPLADILELEYEELLVNYLSDNIAFSLLEEGNSEAILVFTEQKVKKYRSNNSKQLDLSF